MPYKSDSQRRWAHTSKGEKALGGPEAVNEWAQATKGKTLPEHVKMAEGGIVDYKQAIKDYFAKHQKGMPEMGSTLGSDTQGLQGLANKLKMNQEPDAINLPGIPALPGIPPVPGKIPPPYDGRTIQNYAVGGIVDPNEITDTSGIDSLRDAAAPPSFDPKIGLPPQPPPPMATQSPVNAPNTAITDYLGAQKSQLGKYGPEEQMAVSKNLLAAQNGLGGRVANGLSTFADALMQGVAGKGNPGFAKALQDRQQNQANMQLGALQGANASNRQNVGDIAKLDAQDPNSALSASQRAQKGPVLSALGIDPKTIGQMSASEIDGAVSLLSTAGIENRKIMVQQIKNAIEARAANESIRHNQTEEGLKAKEVSETAKQHGAENTLKTEAEQQGALEKAASIPLTSRVANMFGMNPAQKALEEKAGLGNSTSSAAPEVNSQEMYDSLPSGASYIAKGILHRKK